MILPPSRRSSAPHARALCRAACGFTVLEVFSMVILLSVLFALMITNMDFSAAKWSVRPARESLIRAVGEAHNLARLHKEDLFLRYNPEASVLLLENVSGTEILRVPITQGEVNAIKFYRVLPEKERSESPAYEPEEDPVPSVAFAPSGSSTPVIIEIDTNKGRNSLLFDPFSLRLIQDNLN